MLIHRSSYLCLHPKLCLRQPSRDRAQCHRHSPMRLPHNFKYARPYRHMGHGRRPRHDGRKLTPHNKDGYILLHACPRRLHHILHRGARMVSRIAVSIFMYGRELTHSFCKCIKHSHWISTQLISLICGVSRQRPCNTCSPMHRNHVCLIRLSQKNQIPHLLLRHPPHAPLTPRED